MYPAGRDDAITCLLDDECHGLFNDVGHGGKASKEAAGVGVPGVEVGQGGGVWAATSLDLTLYTEHLTFFREAATADVLETCHRD